jgi:hypothetical protein
MLTRAHLRDQSGSALIGALLVMLVMLPLGLALLSIVDTQARDSGSERTRDRAFNLADSALGSATFNLGRFAWPVSGATAPSNLGATGTAAACGTASYGASLDAPTNPGSATAKLQPNLVASYDDPAYVGATWQINVCDDDPAAAGPTVWKDALLTRLNYDQNANQQVWVRAQATVAGHTRVLAALVKAAQTPALSSKYGLMTGRMNAEVTNTAGALLTGGLVGSLASRMLGTQPLVAADPSYVTDPATSGVTAVRCGALDGCLTGTLASVSSLPLFDTLISGGKLVQATSPAATSDAAIAQLKQQAINSGTYVASTAGMSSTTSPPLCAIPAAADSTTIVYIEAVGDGDQFCRIDVSTNPSYKALVIGHGRVVLRGDDTASGGTFTGLVYALNQQRATLGDAALPPREVIRIDRGAHVLGGVAADGKSAQVGVYPPPLCGTITVAFLQVDTCVALGTLALLSILDGYNPAIQASVSQMNAVKIYGTASAVSGSYRDVAGERG